MADQYPRIAIFIFYGVLIGLIMHFMEGLKTFTETTGIVVGGAVGIFISLWLWQNYGKVMVSNQNSY